jgi:hypothetical protein
MPRCGVPSREHQGTSQLPARVEGESIGAFDDDCELSSGAGVVGLDRRRRAAPTVLGSERSQAPKKTVLSGWCCCGQQQDLRLCEADFGHDVSQVS